jgi:hypothetical protein
MNANGQSAYLPLGTSLKPISDPTHLLEKLSGGVQKFLSSYRWSGSAIASLEKVGPQAMFQLSQPSTEGRLPYMQALSRLPQTPVLRRNYGPPKIPEVEFHPLNHAARSRSTRQSFKRLPLFGGTLPMASWPRMNSRMRPAL